MYCAIVLGNNEHMIWTKGEEQTVFYRKQDIPEWVDGQTVIEDWMGEEE